MKKTVVFVTGLLPSGHYSQYITSGLQADGKINLLVYTDRSLENLKVKGCGKIIPTWRKSPLFFLDILRQLAKDKPDLVHFQHEFNMYGGMFTAAMFPLLVGVVKLMGIKVVTTIHAAVPKTQINPEFAAVFNQNPKIIRPWMLKLFFTYAFKTLELVSNSVIVHTNLLKQILVRDYLVNENKVNVIPAAIPQKTVYVREPKKYFFYFGYMARRKGLGFAIRGFTKFIKKYPKSKFEFILAGGVIKGQESSLNEILDEIKKTKMESHIKYLGFLEESEQDRYYQQAYAVVIPAVISMGSSGPLYHANSYGKCVLATKIGHYLEDIDDGQTGILVDNRDWSRAFEYTVDNPDVVKSIENNTIAKAKSRSPLKTAQRYYKLYSQLI